MDPRDILGEDMEHEGVDSREGTGPTSVRGGDEPTEQRPSKPNPLDEPAGKAECRKAAAHVQEVLVKEGVVSEPSDAGIEKATKGCVARGDTLREVRCLQRVSNNEDIDACLP